MTVHTTLEQRIADAAQALDARHRDLTHHRTLLLARVVSKVRKSPVALVLGVALLALAWHRIRYRRRD